MCRHCGDLDNAEHTIFLCQRLHELKIAAERTLNLNKIHTEAFIQIMVRAEKGLDVMHNMVKLIMETMK